jgi:hypothetical protein
MLRQEVAVVSTSTMLLSPRPVAFPSRSPVFFPQGFFFGATEGLTHPDRGAGRLVHDHHWPPVSLSPSHSSHSHRVHSSALNAVALIITSQARTTHRSGGAQGVSKR